MRSQDAIRLGIYPDADFYRARAALYRRQADATERNGERNRLRTLARSMEAKAAAEERAARAATVDQAQPSYQVRSI